MQRTRCLLVLLCFIVSVHTQAANYAYLTKDTEIRHGNRKVETLNKGVTISYDKEKNGRLLFSYKGQNCWVDAKGTIREEALTGFIKQNQNLFNQVAETLVKTKVKDRAKGKTIRRVGVGTQFRIFGEKDGWYKVQLDGTFGWLKIGACKKLCVVDVLSFPKVIGKTKGEKIVNYAKKWVGNPYVWGGTSLTNGADCSGFVQSVYKYFGISLPRCSWEQATRGKKVSFSKMKPGDLIFYYRGSRIGHVTIYAGDGKCVQARGQAYGITVTDWDYSTPAFARRVVTGTINKK